MKSQCGILLTLFGLCAMNAFSSTITGGTTNVALNSSFVSTVVGAGITPAAVAPGTLMTTTATFPITGGDTVIGMIDHSGGLSFTQGSHSAVLENFVIDLNTMLLSGEVVANGGMPMMGVNLFDIGSGNTLTINSTLATDLSAVFGVPNLTGATVGVATVSPIAGSPTPEPSALWLMSIGAVVLAAFRFHRHAMRMGSKI